MNVAAREIDKFKVSTVHFIKGLADESMSIEQGATKHYPELNLKAQSLITSLPAGKAAEFSHCWCKYTETLLNEMCSQSIGQRREQNKLIGNALADALIALN